ncbi:MAG: NADH ubiquinone oxidoreductase [Alphaproteobacteria bacterium]|nr:NADH ubiquinone oxidoreductase [Alphaproteobacteria bacterium]
MVLKFLAPIMTAVIFWTSAVASAGDVLIDDFKRPPELRWEFIADTVMGGVSTGGVSFLQDDGETYARMTGDVSTQNNGGFIQFRAKLPSALPESAVGLRIIARGNDQRYFIHLRTTGTLLPWQYYQAGFEVGRDWSEVRISFDNFKASGSLLRALPKPENVKSIGVVAFGRDHQVKVDVSEVSYY